MSAEVTYTKTGNDLHFSVRPDPISSPDVVYRYLHDARPPEVIIGLAAGGFRSARLMHLDGKSFDHLWTEDELASAPLWTDDAWVKQAARESRDLALHEYTLASATAPNTAATVPEVITVQLD